MAYELIQSGRTEFAIDWTVVRRLLRSYYTSVSQLRYASEVTLSDSHWYNPLSWSLPDVSQLEVDWDAVRRSANAYADDDLRSVQQRAKTDAAYVGRYLEEMVECTGRNKEQFVDWMGDIQTRNMQRIDQAVKDYDADVKIARWVRDTSADGLMVGASVMSGGTATAVMAGGSFFKGYGKFQDSGSIGAAVMEGTGSFVFAYVKLGKSFSFKKDMILALVQAPYKTGTEIVAGATVGKAALSGSLKLTGPAVSSIFKNLEKAPMPVVITYDGKDVAAKFISKMAGTLVQKRGIEDYGKSKILALGHTDTNEDPSESRGRNGQVIAEATLSNKYLLYLAFVNQEKGIGRGW
jgi:hypothetical protein